MQHEYSLEEIKKPVNQALEEFDRHFRTAMSSKVALLDRITYYIVKTKGKQLRPLISLLCAQMFGTINDKSYVAASMVELLHTATLVHDDVVDDSLQRRGFFSIKALWKNKIAVLVGDYLLSRGLLLALKNKHFDLLEILSVAVSAMSEGELLQLEKARRLDISEETYFDIIEKKTASLISAACECGARSTSSDSEMLKQIHSFGSLIGIAFQIKDDLMDFSKDYTGKPKIADIKEKKMTLPLIAALNAASLPEKNYIISLIRNHNEKESAIKEVINFIFQYKGVEYATGKMNYYRDEAIAVINQFPKSDAKESLIKLSHFVTARKK